MPSPPQGNGLKGNHVNSLLSSSPLRSGLSEHHDENRMESENEKEIDVSTGFGFHTNVQETPAGKTNHNFGAHGWDGQPSLITPPDSGSNQHFDSNAFPDEQLISATSPSMLSFSNPSPLTTSTVSTLHQPSQWELRSRSSSPSSLLTSQTTRSREQRKSKFLDRIRRRRDDERSVEVEEQVLRMDFVKERRGWEAEMARRAAVEAMQQEEIENDDDNEEEQELSPTQEYELDTEVDKLVRQYERENMHGVRDDEFMFEDAEDEEYERLFREMEILSQQSHSQSENQPASQLLQQEHEQGQAQQAQHTKRTSFLGRPPSQQPQQHGKAGNDETMDLS
ncbi:uncharacterized protein Z519_08268 [Cladophialophora bantiana CBS 173.52]|uniref:Uncharacterized protein n=1 Tax=Cladophialophora bantiana (strain ATCC 10958 / CBS 173.52 / CDC B-1940 / NIH 8579) TaxID=1442370 RepID=A0A0D2FY24_CLAB1|nr:uncharacterized protein Z519_08268 [Cladophialophora bantiana CBS 173.52]KIW91372.1 hypothetical protein Z519_08268 [Cladophialophora bantiana CBS 173.52]